VILNKKDVMQTVIIELTNKNSLKALRELEDKQLIRIIENSGREIYSLPGEPISNEIFSRWIESAEKSNTLSVNEAKERWITQKRKLNKLSR